MKNIKDFFTILIMVFLILGIFFLAPLISLGDNLLKWEYLNFFGAIFIIIGLLISEIIYLLDVFQFKKTFGDYENSFIKSCKLKFISLLIGGISALVPSALIGSIILALPRIEIPWDKIIGTYLPPIILIVIIFMVFVFMNMEIKGIFFETEEKK